MEIKVGGVYKNRAGDKCTVYKKTSDTWFKCVNHAYDVVVSIRNNGKYSALDNDDDGSDLISEWTEPRTGFINVFINEKTGQITACEPQVDIEDCLQKSSNCYLKRIACVKFTEGTFHE